MVLDAVVFRTVSLYITTVSWLQITKTRNLTLAGTTLGESAQAGRSLLPNYTIMIQDTKTQAVVAVGSFLAAVALAFTSLLISSDHDIAAGVLMMCAQFLMLTATIFGLDYKIMSIIRKFDASKNKS